MKIQKKFYWVLILAYDVEDDGVGLVGLQRRGDGETGLGVPAASVAILDIDILGNGNGN
mgnify:CR=1 FL=1